MQEGAGHTDVVAGQAEAGQRADGRQSRGQAERLPEHDGRGRGPAWPAGLDQCRSPEHAPHGDRGQQRRVSQSRHLPRRHLR